MNDLVTDSREVLRLMGQILDRSMQMLDSLPDTMVRKSYRTGNHPYSNGRPRNHGRDYSVTQKIHQFFNQSQEAGFKPTPPRAQVLHVVMIT